MVAVVRALVVAARAGLLGGGLGNSGVVSMVDAAVELREIRGIRTTSARVGVRYAGTAFWTIGGAGDVFWGGGGFTWGYDGTAFLAGGSSGL